MSWICSTDGTLLVMVSCASLTARSASTSAVWSSVNSPVAAPALVMALTMFASLKSTNLPSRFRMDLNIKIKTSSRPLGCLIYFGLMFVYTLYIAYVLMIVRYI